MKSFMVIGLGRFGKSVATTLYDLGNEVLAIDTNEKEIQLISESVTHAVMGDATDEDMLKSLGAKSFDTAIVAIGDDFNSSVLITLMLKELGVGHIIAKALTAAHAKILEKVGANQIIFPERDMGIRIAHKLSSAKVIDSLEIASGYAIAEITAPKNWWNRNIMDIKVRQKYGLNVIAIRRDEEVLTAPDAKTVIEEGDTLVVMGSIDSLNAL